jgi:hypothetical protein
VRSLHNWKDEPGTLPLLASVAVNDDAAGVRYRALIMILTIWADNASVDTFVPLAEEHLDSATVTFLKDRAFKDRSFWLRDKLKETLHPMGIGGGLLSENAGMCIDGDA